MELIAWLGVFALVMQMLALGHWGGSGPGPGQDAAEHALHCHGLTLTCGSGLSSALNDLTPVRALPQAPAAQRVPPISSPSGPVSAYIPSSVDPPRAA